MTKTRRIIAIVDTLRQILAVAYMYRFREYGSFRLLTSPGGGVRPGIAFRSNGTSAIFEDIKAT